jgi:cholesterol oxidase
VVMAAGTLNTLRLLFASSASADGLASMPALGRGFFANGDIIGASIRPSTSVPGSLVSPVQGTLTVAGHEGWPVLVGSLPGFDGWPLPGFLKRLISRVLCMFAMGVDSTTASATWIKGRLRSDYDCRKEPVYDELHDALRIVGEELGIKLYSPRKPLSPHMGGGARIGANAQDGVVDHRGEVYGNPGLFVMDASALPAPTGGPPSVTIAAWAHHVADGMAGSA